MSKKRKKKISPVNKKEEPPAVPQVHKPRSSYPSIRVALAIGLFAVVGIAALLLIRKFDEGRKIGSGAFKNQNVILITIDTLRADHLPVYGYSNVKTPNIDRLAESSLLFQDVIAEVPLTLPSHTSLLTGLLPTKHGVRDNATFVLDPKITTLAETLKSDGYATAAFVSSVVLDSRQQLNQGFDLYYDNFEESGVEEAPGAGIERRAADTEKEAEEWLMLNKDKKSFVWIHFYDPHDPYKPPEPYKSEYASNRYDGEIAYTDEVIGKLLTKLEELQLMNKTILILTADHGESLGEHGEPTHGIFLYDSTIKVPLLIRLPEGKPKRIPDLARHIDIAPTVLDWLGIFPDPSVQGKSLVQLIQGKEKQKRIAYSESKFGELHYGWSPLESMTSSDYKFINAPKAELYARKEDPRETNNIIQQKNSIAKVLKDDLQEILKTASTADLQSTTKVNPEMEEKLRALGYVSTTMQSTPESRKIDPKDKIYLHRHLAEAYSAITEKNYPQVIEKLSPLLKESADKQSFNIVEAHYLAGIAYAHLRQYPKAIEALQTTIRLRPDHTQALYNLAFAYHVTENYQEAEKYYKVIFAFQKDYLPAVVGLAKLYRVMNQPAEADQYFRKAVDAYQKSLLETKGSAARSKIHRSLAEIYFNANDMNRAEENLKAAIELTPQEPALHYNLAQMYEARNQPLKAIEEYRKEIEISPSNYMAQNNLGLLYRQVGQLDVAIESFRQVLKIIPGDVQASYSLAETSLMAGRNLDEALRMARYVVRQKPEFQPAQKLLAAIEKRLGESG
jgi:arylsulfatase A-like enzyme/Tfp pilus assembly protein PilF